MFASFSGPAEEVGDDGQREDLGEVADPVETAEFQEVVDEGVGALLEVVVVFAECPGGEGAAHHAAHMVVVGRVADEGAALHFLVEGVVERHTVAGGEGAVVVEGRVDVVVAGDGPHLVALQPHCGGGVAEPAVGVVRVEDDFFGVEVEVGGGGEGRHRVPFCVVGQGCGVREGSLRWRRSRRR